MGSDNGQESVMHVANRESEREREREWEREGKKEEQKRCAHVQTMKCAKRENHRNLAFLSDGCAPLERHMLSMAWHGNAQGISAQAFTSRG